MWSGIGYRPVECTSFLSYTYLVVSSDMKIEKQCFQQSSLCTPVYCAQHLRSCSFSSCKLSPSRRESLHGQKNPVFVSSRRPAHDRTSSSILHVLFPTLFPSSLLVKTYTVTEGNLSTAFPTPKLAESRHLMYQRSLRRSKSRLAHLHYNVLQVRRRHNRPNSALKRVR